MDSTPSDLALHPSRLRRCTSAPVQDCYLAYFLTELAGATFMVFTRTCEAARRLALQLRNLGFDALPIHGQMSQPKRLGALNKFKAASAPSWLPRVGFSFPVTYFAGYPVLIKAHSLRGCPSSN